MTGREKLATFNRLSSKAYLRRCPVTESFIHSFIRANILWASTGIVIGSHSTANSASNNTFLGGLICFLAQVSAHLICDKSLWHLSLSLIYRRVEVTKTVSPWDSEVKIIQQRENQNIKQIFSQSQCHRLNTGFVQAPGNVPISYINLVDKWEMEPQRVKLLVGWAMVLA